MDRHGAKDSQGRYLRAVTACAAFSTCQLSIIAAVVLLSPVFAFLIAIAVEILIGSLIVAGGVPALLAVIAGVIWLVAVS